MCGLRRVSFVVLGLAGFSLACGRTGVCDHPKDQGEALRWRRSSETVVMRVFRESGMARGRRVFTLYGSGELEMERYAENYTKLLEERSRRLSDEEVCDLLQGVVASRLPEWTAEKLSPVSDQIRRTSDMPYLHIEGSLLDYPPLGGPIDFSAGFAIEARRSTTPVFESFDEIVAAWKLESALRSIWEETRSESVAR